MPARPAWSNFTLYVYYYGSELVLGAAGAWLVAAVLNGLTERSARVKLCGGELQVTWNPDDNHIYQSGPAAFVFDGTWLDN